jgi:hypothetical protein
MDCPTCGALLERADYLEGEDGFEEAMVCMECDDDKYYPIVEEPACRVCAPDDSDNGYTCAKCASLYLLLDEGSCEEC